MKCKSLVFVDGTDSYMDINLLLEYSEVDILGEVQKVLGQFEIPRMDNLPVIFYNRLLSLFNDTSIPLRKTINRKMTLFNITYNSITKEIEEKLNEDSEIDKLQKKFYRFRNKHGYGYGKLKKLQLEIDYIKNNNKKVAESVLKRNFMELYDLLPEQFKSINTDEIGYYFYNEQIINIFIKDITINTKGLAYLEQQNELGRIKLSDGGLLLLSSLKDFARFRDDDMTFDKYLGNWAKKLLREENEILSDK